MTMNLSKILYLVSLVLILLALVVNGPLVTLGLAALAAGHLFEGG